MELDVRCGVEAIQMFPMLIEEVEANLNCKEVRNDAMIN